MHEMHSKFAVARNLQAACAVARSFLGPGKALKCIIDESSESRNILAGTIQAYLLAADGDPTASTLLLEALESQTGGPGATAASAPGSGATWLAAVCGLLLGGLLEAVEGQGVPYEAARQGLLAATAECCQVIRSCAVEIPLLVGELWAEGGAGLGAEGGAGEAGAGGGQDQGVGAATHEAGGGSGSAQVRQGAGGVGAPYLAAVAARIHPPASWAQRRSSLARELQQHLPPPLQQQQQLLLQQQLLREQLQEQAQRAAVPAWGVQARTAAGGTAWHGGGGLPPQLLGTPSPSTDPAPTPAGAGRPALAPPGAPPGTCPSPSGRQLPRRPTQCPAHLQGAPQDTQPPATQQPSRAWLQPSGARPQAAPAVAATLRSRAGRAPVPQGGPVSHPHQEAVCGQVKEEEEQLDDGQEDDEFGWFDSFMGAAANEAAGCAGGAAAEQQAPMDAGEVPLQHQGHGQGQGQQAVFGSLLAESGSSSSSDSSSSSEGGTDGGRGSTRCRCDPDPALAALLQLARAGRGDTPTAAAATTTAPPDTALAHQNGRRGTVAHQNAAAATAYAATTFDDDDGIDTENGDVVNEGEDGDEEARLQALEEEVSWFFGARELDAARAARAERRSLAALRRGGLGPLGSAAGAAAAAAGRGTGLGARPPGGGRDVRGRAGNDQDVPAFVAAGFGGPVLADGGAVTTAAAAVVAAAAAAAHRPQRQLLLPRSGPERQSLRQSRPDPDFGDDGPDDEFDVWPAQPPARSHQAGRQPAAAQSSPAMSAAPAGPAERGPAPPASDGTTAAAAGSAWLAPSPSPALCGRAAVPHALHGIMEEARLQVDTEAAAEVEVDGEMAAQAEALAAQLVCTAAAGLAHGRPREMQLAAAAVLVLLQPLLRHRCHHHYHHQQQQQQLQGKRQPPSLAQVAGWVQAAAADLSFERCVLPLELAGRWGAATGAALNATAPRAAGLEAGDWDDGMGYGSGADGVAVRGVCVPLASLSEAQAALAVSFLDGLARAATAAPAVAAAAAAASAAAQGSSGGAGGGGGGSGGSCGCGSSGSGGAGGALLTAVFFLGSLQPEPPPAAATGPHTTTTTTTILPTTTTTILPATTTTVLPTTTTTILPTTTAATGAASTSATAAATTPAASSRQPALWPEHETGDCSSTGGSSSSFCRFRDAEQDPDPEVAFAARLLLRLQPLGVQLLLASGHVPDRVSSAVQQLSGGRVLVLGGAGVRAVRAAAACAAAAARATAAATAAVTPLPAGSATAAVAPAAVAPAAPAVSRLSGVPASSLQLLARGRNAVPGVRAALLEGGLGLGDYRAAAGRGPAAAAARGGGGSVGHMAPGLLLQLVMEGVGPAAAAPLRGSARGPGAAAVVAAPPPPPPGPGWVTVLLAHPLPMQLEASAAAFRVCFCRLVAALRCGRVLPGGGAWEVAAAEQLELRARALERDIAAAQERQERQQERPARRQEWQQRRQERQQRRWQGMGTAQARELQLGTRAGGKVGEAPAHPEQQYGVQEKEEQEGEAEVEEEDKEEEEEEAVGLYRPLCYRLLAAVLRDAVGCLLQNSGSGGGGAGGGGGGGGTGPGAATALVTACGRAVSCGDLGALRRLAVAAEPEATPGGGGCEAGRDARGGWGLGLEGGDGGGEWRQLPASLLKLMTLWAGGSGGVGNADGGSGGSGGIEGPRGGSGGSAGCCAALPPAVWDELASREVGLKSACRLALLASCVDAVIVNR